jgi:hypothetical protein
MPFGGLASFTNISSWLHQANYGLTDSMSRLTLAAEGADPHLRPRRARPE